MMKRTTTFLIAILFCFMSSTFEHELKAQSLQNTTWNFFDASNTPLVTGIFGNDTLFFALPTPAPVAIFTDTLNTFTIRDIDTTQCGSGVGSYTYSISSGPADTLRFTIVSEPCQIRGAFFAPNYGIRVLVGNEENQLSESKVKVYPNPSSGQFQFDIPSQLIGSQATIRDLSGRVIENFRISEINQLIEIDGPKGIYLLQIDQYGNKPIIKKLIVQ